MHSGVVKDYFVGLQDNIVSRLEELDGTPFRRDSWNRPQGGGGISRLVEQGNLFERGGVNFSHVYGQTLPPSASASRPELAGCSFEAMGVSLVLHPHNPYVPTVHMNVRFFLAMKEGAEPVWWFGGGMDLTPYYGFEEDAIHFHTVCKQALSPFGAEVHAEYKAWCDRYFFLKHRKEPRGIGGGGGEGQAGAEFLRAAFGCDDYGVGGVFQGKAVFLAEGRGVGVLGVDFNELVLDAELIQGGEHGAFRIEGVGHFLVEILTGGESRRASSFRGQILQGRRSQR